MNRTEKQEDWKTGQKLRKPGLPAVVLEWDHLKRSATGGGPKCRAGLRIPWVSCGRTVIVAEQTPQPALASDRAHRIGVGGSGRGAGDLKEIGPMARDARNRFMAISYGCTSDNGDFRGACPGAFRAPGARPRGVMSIDRYGNRVLRCRDGAARDSKG